MLFNSFQYLFFFCGSLIVNWSLRNHPRLRIWFLVLASFYFYFSDNGSAVLLLLLCMQIDYWAAQKIHRSVSPKVRKVVLLISMATNLGILAFFKYFNFFADSVAHLASSMGQSVSWVPWNIALPVGISFYTFESMSYTIDVYRGLITPEKRWSRYALFVSYFPHLIAGPILRPRDFIPQLDLKPKWDFQNADRGLFLIAQGLIKKVLLGDFFGNLVDPYFAAGPDAGGWGPALVIVFAFSFQIYFDFSGYTDIAIGCAKLMGFHIPINFRFPYSSQSITDFWRRWHISLSSWLRDYLFIPLGGSRGSTAKTYRNLMITMILGGLWHGAAWHFVLWGFLQGLMLVIEKKFGWGKTDEDGPIGLRIVRSAGVFILVTLSWLVFRAESMTAISRFMQNMVNFSEIGEVSAEMRLAAVVMVGAWIWQNVAERFKFEDWLLRVPVPVRLSVYACVAMASFELIAPVARPFIYFRF